ncbi:MAG TPA: heme-binding protein [Gemmatimonadaceae bacterium]
MIVAWRAGAGLTLAACMLLAGCNRGEGNGVDTPRSMGAKGPEGSDTDCSVLPDAAALQKLVRSVPDSGEAGGLFGGRAEWAAIVNRAGIICVVVPPNDSVGGRWPGSRTIAMAKAFTANGFSTDTAALSTARLYTLTQPGHSLWGVGQPEPFDPECLDPKSDQKICGGAIAFGGGVPLYRGGRIVGGLGVSGDTPCTDHEIAKRIRNYAMLNPAKGPYVDDISYGVVDGPSIYTHPLCPNTWRNGKKIGEEAVATGY